MMRGRIVVTMVAGLSAVVIGWSVRGTEPTPAMLDAIRHLEKDPLYVRMQEAMAAGNTTEAHALVTQLLTREYFSLGMKAFGEGNYAGAAADFERVLGFDPEHHRARAELARTYFSMGEFVRSRREFERVLTAEPPPAVTRNIRQFLQRMDQQPSEKNWSLQFGAGALYDDNVNFGPASDVVQVRPISFGGAPVTQLSVSEASQPVESWGAYTYATLAGAHDAGQRGAWLLAGEGSYYQTWLEDATDFNIIYGRAGAGPRHVGAHHLLDLPVKYERIHRGGDLLVDILGLAPSFVQAATPARHWITTATAEARDYDEFNELDSYYLKLGQSGRWFVGPERHTITAGAAGFFEDADTTIYSNAGLEVLLGGQVHLPLRSSAAFSVQYRGEWYDEREDLAPESRRDDEIRIEAQLRKRLAAHLSLNGGYQYTRNYSTFDLYDYERNLVTVGVAGDL